MCLQSVFEKKPATSGFGWKVFIKRKAILRSENRGSREFEYDVWYKANPPDISLSTAQMVGLVGAKYPVGFHIALRRQDARNFLKDKYGSGKCCVVRKVEFRQAHTLGTGGSYFPGAQVIAEEIRIIKPAKGGSAYKKRLDTSSVI